MYRIINDNIHITRGETATYDVRVIDNVTGAPFILPPATSDSHKFAIVFSVRRSDYIKDGYAIKKIMWVNNDTLLKDDVIYNYLDTEDIWDTDYFEESGERTDSSNMVKQYKTKKACFRKKQHDGSYDYRYWNPDTNEWLPYSFEIKFPLLYADTATLSPKSYKYAMTIYGGNNLTELDGKIDEDTIDYKKPLVAANFIVEADINE